MKRKENLLNLVICVILLLFGATAIYYEIIPSSYQIAIAIVICCVLYGLLKMYKFVMKCYKAASDFAFRAGEQTSNLIWLFNLGEISKEEYEAIKEELDQKKGLKECAEFLDKALDGRTQHFFDQIEKKTERMTQETERITKLLEELKKSSK